MKTKSLIRKWVKVLTGIVSSLLCGFTLQAATVIDHNCTNIEAIPEAAIVQAKSSLHIAYGHTSHGSQLADGMSALVAFMNGKGHTANLYDWNHGGTGGALDLHDYAMGGDVGYYPDWLNNTVSYLGPVNPSTGRGTTNPDVNVIVWSWCGQAAWYSEQQMISEYLTPMSNLEATYPGVKFVYMTCHLNGTGATGNLNLRNNQIRAYCQANNKILYDFADIESYDPDGLINYMPLLCDDACNYDSDNDGSLDTNWALNWQNSHTENVDWYSCSAAHSQSLNGNRKAYAAWWLWAMLAGWNDNSQVLAPASVTAVADSVAQTITVSWADQAGTSEESSYIIQRQVDGGAWNTAYASVGSNVLTFTDSNLSVGTYAYRIVTHLNDGGSGLPADSQASGTASAQIVAATPPGAPTNLTLSANSSQKTITLAWTDNSATETSFIIQRQFNGGVWNNAFAAVNANTVTYTDASLSAGTYRYRIVAHNEFGNSAPTSEQEASILDFPASPTSLAASPDNTTGTVSLSWVDASGNETGFIIQRQVDGGAWNNQYATLGANVTAYTDNNQGNGQLTAGTYAYRVCAYNANGNSNPSNTASAQITTSLPAAPSGLIVSANNGNLVLTWADNSTNETSFQIERHLESGAYALINEPAANITTWTNTGLSGSHTYYFRVRARNSLGFSAYSNEVSIIHSISVTPSTLTLQTTSEVDDSFLQDSDPNTNYGTIQYVSTFRRYVCKFNLPAVVMNKKIVSAKMGVYVWNQSNYQPNQYMYLYNVTSSWQENAVTYNTTPSHDATPVASILHLSGSANWDHTFYPPMDITSLVQSWADNTIANNGVLLSNELSLTGIGMKASEYSNNARTYLEITYTDKTNEAPVINALNPVNVYEGERISLDIAVTDPNSGDTLTLTPSGLPAGAVLTKKDCCTWTLTWQTGFENAGTFDVTFTASDGTLSSDPVALTLTVNNVSTSLGVTNKPEWFQVQE